MLGQLLNMGLLLPGCADHKRDCRQGCLLDWPGKAMTYGTGASLRVNLSGLCLPASSVWAMLVVLGTSL